MNMSIGAKKMRDFYAMKPNAPFYLREFGFYSLERWQKEGHLPIKAEDKDKNVFGFVEDTVLDEIFGFDPPGKYMMNCLGWCEPGFCPVFEDKVLRTETSDSGDEYDIVQDFAGRTVKCFKGRRSGFMPEYIGNPVKDLKTWEEDCLPRMNPATPERQKDIQAAIAGAKAAAAEGQVICANLVGGYMYLRALIGPVNLLYFFYDEPELLHKCMETWFNLADTVYTQMQKEVVFDELFIGEDISYNNGLLISPDMIKEFLFPYYQQLKTNIKARQLDKTRRLYFQVDTDGRADAPLPLYKSIGMDFMSPFEVASGSDVVRSAKEYPDLLMLGGFDKRILAKTTDDIDREVDRIMPVLHKRGGYIPTCDHGVPAEVSFENYVHFRNRLREFS